MLHRTAALLLALPLMLLVGACTQDDAGGGGSLLVADNPDGVRWGDESRNPDQGDAANNGNDAPNNTPSRPIDGGDAPAELVEAPGHSGSTTQCGTEVESEAFRLLNADRQKQGLEPLQCDDDLLIVARLHDFDMSDRGFFAHTNPDGEQPWDRMDRHGITRWRLVGENIASGQRTPAEVQNAWMNSPGHRANILTPEFTHVGVGFYRDAKGQTFWTQLFATF